MLEIVDIDFTLDYQTFRNIVDDVISEISSNKGIGFDYNDKEAHLSRSNRAVFKLTFTNTDSSNTIDVVANKVNNSIEFKPIELRNYNNSFYTYNYYDDDLTEVMLTVLKRSAIKGKGSFGCILDGKCTLVKDGRDISTHIVGIAIIDDRGKVYHLKHDQNLDNDDEDDNNNAFGYVPRYLINDWLDENLQFQSRLQTVPKTEQFELMAQFAIYQKRKDMLTADQFKDILLQVGTFAEMVGGFKDESIKNIYQFFV